MFSFRDTKTKIVAITISILIHLLVIALFFLHFVKETQPKQGTEELDTYFVNPVLLGQGQGTSYCGKTYRGIGVIINYGTGLVAQVAKDGPAEKAGVMIGDYLISEYFGAHSVGTLVTIEVIRNGQSLKLTATIDDICYE